MCEEDRMCKGANVMGLPEGTRSVPEPDPGMDTQNTVAQQAGGWAEDI